MVFLNHHNKVFKSTFDLEIFCHLQKAVEIILSNTHLPMIHKVKNRFHLFGTDTLKVEQEVLVVLSPSQDVSEERTAGTEDDFVSL